MRDPTETVVFFDDIWYMRDMCTRDTASFAVAYDPQARCGGCTPYSRPGGCSGVPSVAYLGSVAAPFVFS